MALRAVAGLDVLHDALGLGHRDAALVVNEHWHRPLAGDPLYLVALRMEPLHPDAVELDVPLLQFVDD